MNVDVDVHIKEWRRLLIFAETSDSVVQTDPLLVPNVEEVVERLDKETCKHSDKETGSNQSVHVTSGDVSPELLLSSSVETTPVSSGNYVYNFSYALYRFYLSFLFCFPKDI